MFLWFSYEYKTQKWSGLNGCGVNVQYDNRFIVNHLQSLHIILIEYAIIVESMPTDLKSFSVLQKYVCDSCLVYVLSHACLHHLFCTYS